MAKRASPDSDFWSHALSGWAQDVSLATDVLKLFQTTQSTYVADRDRLKALVQRLN